MDKRKILIQLDSDPQPSVFDRVVAIDAGADEVFSYGSVKPEQVRAMVQGAIFTRGGPKDLSRTAFFISGSDVVAAEHLLDEVKKHMLPEFGLRVSVLLDASGANTTAAAAVSTAARHVDLAGAAALVLGGTGPVGRRVARLLARQGAEVRVASRQRDRALSVCEAIKRLVSGARVEPAAAASRDLETALAGRTLVIAAGAAGTVLLPLSVRASCSSLRVVIDLNAVPPLGVEGVELADKATERDGVICYGAIGVGGTKMKVHKAAIARLFESNDHVMDAEEVYALAAALS